MEHRYEVVRIAKGRDGIEYAVWDNLKDVRVIAFHCPAEACAHAPLWHSKSEHYRMAAVRHARELNAANDAAVRKEVA